MISRDEIDSTALDLDISLANVQRDYVFGWLISGLFQASQLGTALVLKGGNALRKAYFPLTRFSDDLDFSTSNGIDSEFLLAQLNEVCRFVEARAGVQFDLDRNRVADEQQIDRERRVYKIRLYFQDFAGIGNEITLKVRTDVTEFDRLYLPSQTRNLIHQYSDADQCATQVQVVKLEEALADKLKCLLQRRYCYDLFDAVYAIFISNELAVDRAEIVRVFLKKTIFEPSPGTAKNLLLGLPFELFRGYWHTVICPAASRMTFDDAVSALLGGLESLFAPFGYGQQFEHAFFPARLRNLILQAGSDRKLLQIRYHGATRLVEPYSLTFKRRKVGGAREYFYAWDRTGGNSGPGIKSSSRLMWRRCHLLTRTSSRDSQLSFQRRETLRRPGTSRGRQAVVGADEGPIIEEAFSSKVRYSVFVLWQAVQPGSLINSPQSSQRPLWEPMLWSDRLSAFTEPHESRTSRPNISETVCTHRTDGDRGYGQVRLRQPRARGSTAKSRQA